MRIIKRDPLENGAHENLEIIGELVEIPKGWMVIPEDMQIPETFPFVDMISKDGKILQMRAGVMPKEKPAPPTEIEKLEAQILYTAAMTDTLLDSEVDI